MRHSGIFETLANPFAVLFVGHYLNELDEDLLAELDEVVRQNQLACMPFGKSGRAEMLLHERHPELAPIIDRNRQAKIDAASLRAKFSGLENLTAYGEELSSSPMQQKSRRRASHVAAASDRPSLKGKASSKDMMFDMDDEFDAESKSPGPSPSIRPMSAARVPDTIPSSPPEEVWYDSRGKVLPSPRLGPQTTVSGSVTPRTPKSPLMTGKTPPASQPWSMAPLPGAKTEMRDIMAQAASSRTSSLSQGLAGSRPSLPDAPSPFSLPGPKMSQKERKKLQQSQSATAVPEASPKPGPAPAPSKPWQTALGPKATSLKDVLNSASTPPNTAAGGKSPSTGTPQLTMRQTVANSKAPGPSEKPVIGPSRQSTVEPTNSKPIPHSIRHQPPVEPILGLSMSEIVAQQQFEKDVVKEAVAKRDLQDIQAEQEFEEWWQQESARVQDAEKRSASAATKNPKRHRHRAARGKAAGRGNGEQNSGNTAT